MKKIMFAAVAAIALAGCRVVEVENYGAEVVRNVDGSLVIGTNGVAQTVSKGWSVYHNQHWMVTDADSITASIKPQEIAFEMNGLKSAPSEELARLVDVAMSGAANLAAKIGAAIVTSGAAPAVDAVTALVKKYINAGGDIDKAVIDCKDGACTITDGEITCTGDDCIL